MKDGFEISVEYIHALYQFSKKEVNSIHKAQRIIEKTRKDIYQTFGFMPLKEINKLRYLKYEKEYLDPHNDPERLEEVEKELNELEKKYPNAEVHLRLYELESILPDTDYNPFLPGFCRDFEDFVMHASKIKLDSLKLIFNVWHKALKKNKNSNIKLLEEKLNEYRQKTMGTDKEYLLKKWDGLDKDFEFDSLRKKSLYGLNLFYNDLADFIYKKSFIEKIPPKKG